MTRYFLCFIVFLLPFNLSAEQWSALHSLLPKGTQLSYIVTDPLKKRVITQSQQEILRTPASMQKLLTAAAAKLYLGDDFRYQTTIEGQKSRISRRSYQGDLTFRFVGDPTLLRADISTMLNSLKRLNIKQINGDLLLNETHFNGYQWSNGQAWNDLGVCYTAPSSAIVINKNCVLGNLSLSKSDAEKATLYIPSYEPVDISSDVSVVTAQQREEQFCDLEVTRNSQNRYHLWGCMVPRNRAFPLAFAVNDPFEYAQQIISDELQKAGIKISGQVKLDNSNKKDIKEQILVSHHSPALSEMLRTMMKESDNLIADSLFKTLGAAYFNTSGNFRNGGQALKLILLEHGIDLENAYLADGSGLSRHNLMSAELFMSVLNYVYLNDNKLNLLSTFSVAGIDGTLQYHQALRRDLFKSKIIAKTGSMKGVTNLLGIVKSLQGDRLFVLILNGYNTESSGKNKTEPKYHFEQAFFEKMMSSTSAVTK
ncbi:D-alanyl-D-alanine carboxypeptidase/D-alanyl-D-alanine endopeptidase [Psychromonas ossibalaenae]|uniref:D-alanyl-D-alanine carboxypeptidase/D-alanyl-D-alanine endopeptidase n=1 Tax=Psychromonas ossibalaenae TaxID=444922 RepID=UPI000364814D|nr:D-alanyl-D-alanine carboxypeptidase/D-alanyl-D-alanine-endopeptidase [Psychromonas ossibalaenae]